MNLPFLHLPKGAWPAPFLCLVLNCALFVGIGIRHPQYLIDSRTSLNPDALHYVIIGRNFFLHGEYSRSDAPPYKPDMLRTPIYPLFAGALDLLGGPAAIYFTQILLHLSSCVLTYSIVAHAVGQRSAVFASILLASDLVLVGANFCALSETLCLFLVLVAIQFMICSKMFEPAKQIHWLHFAAGSLGFALAILTRPAMLFLPVLLLAAAFWIRCRRPSLLRTAGQLAVSALITFLPAVVWTARNDAQFGIPRLTNVDVNNTVYFVGAAAYQVEHNVTLEAAQEQIAAEFGLEPYAVVQNAHVASRPLRDMDAELLAARWHVLAKYPRCLLLGCTVGIGKAFTAHNTADLSYLLNLLWVRPGFSQIITGNPDALTRLGANDLLLLSAFGWQLLHTAILIVAAAAGVVALLRPANSSPIRVLLVFILIYCVFTVALFGFEATYRCRIPAIPFLALFAGTGLAHAGTIFCERASKAPHLIRQCPK